MPKFRQLRARERGPIFRRVCTSPYNCLLWLALRYATVTTPVAPTIVPRSVSTFDVYFDIVLDIGAICFSKEADC